MNWCVSQVVGVLLHQPGTLIKTRTVLMHCDRSNSDYQKYWHWHNSATKQPMCYQDKF